MLYCSCLLAAVAEQYDAVRSGVCLLQPTLSNAGMRCRRGQPQSAQHGTAPCQPSGLRADMPLLCTRSQVVKAMMVFWTAGFVLMTLGINAPMLPFVLRVLGLSKVGSDTAVVCSCLAFVHICALAAVLHFFDTKSCR